MNIRELSLEEFNNFTKHHPLKNFYQSINYALLKTEIGYEYEFVGYSENNMIIAAALILYKKINGYYYGYSPRGFIIDYSNYYLLKNFTKQLVDYYRKKGFIFIKINPEIGIGKYHKDTNKIVYNENYQIIENLVNCGYKKLTNNINFETLLPKYNAIVNLKDFDINKLSKNTRNKVKKGIRKGLKLEKVDKSGIEVLYNFIKNKRVNDSFYYKSLYNVFSRANSIDLFLVSIDYKTFLINSQDFYNDELERNNELNKKMIAKPIPSIINKKMNSDKALLAYKNDISYSSKNLLNKEKKYIAGALIIKHGNRISFEITGFDKRYKDFSPNYFMFYEILNYYKEDYKYADLDGVSGDFTKESKYKGLNRFKLGFNSDIYEYIGEFDLVIEDRVYNMLLKRHYLEKEFNKEKK